MNVGDFDMENLGFDWFMLGLRVAFIFLIFAFLYQAVRVMIRELVVLGTVTSGSSVSSATHVASASLEVLEPAESGLIAGQRIALNHHTTIGRQPHNALQIADSFVSGSHAEIVLEQGDWWVIDVRSRNGTFVNDQPVGSRVRLSSGDLLRFGRVELRAIL